MIYKLLIILSCSSLPNGYYEYKVCNVKDSKDLGNLISRKKFSMGDTTSVPQYDLSVNKISVK